MPELILRRVRQADPVPVTRRHDVLTAVSRRPRVWVRDGLLDHDECAELRNAGTAPERLGVATTRMDVTGRSFEWPIAAHPLTVELDRRITDAIGEPTEVGGTLRYRQYAPGEGHPPHMDNFRIGEHDLVATAMVCLSDCEAGGSTSFRRGAPPVAIASKVGRLVLWSNCLPDGAPDLLAHHAGETVTAGAKVTLTAFVYRNPTTSAFVRSGPVGVGR